MNYIYMGMRMTIDYITMKTKQQQIPQNGLAVLICLFLFSSRLFSQTLVINEVSQGVSGTKEYVELLVVGAPTCSSIPCLDLRNYIIDDNNGTFASGGGTGIAAGCVRFKNDPFWSCIPIGTLILIYNDADPGPIPPDDLSMSDGNCRLVIPVSNCTYLERNTSQPSTANAAFPTTGFTTCGAWTHLGMSNTDDSFQTMSAGGALMHAVSWGNNTNSNIIYFAGSAGGKVALMTNSIDNNPANQANWLMLPAASNETPGAPNCPANANWISWMNNNCQPLSPFTYTVNSTNTSCFCSGTASITTAASGPLSYTWMPGGANTPSLSGLCYGNYSVTVAGSGGCPVTHTFAIAVAPSMTFSITQTNVTCFGGTTGNATVTPSGGAPPYTYTWMPSVSSGSTASNLSAGVYTVIVGDANLCQQLTHVTITEPSQLTVALTTTNVSCSGAADGRIAIAAAGGTGAYTYSCSPVSPMSVSPPVVFGLSPNTYTITVYDANNCSTNNAVTITSPAAISSTMSSTNSLCNQANGSATMTVAGGTGPYTYSWSPVSSTAGTIGGLLPGTYTVQVKDAHQCTQSNMATIASVGNLSSAISSSSVSCQGGASGSATLTVTGGTGTYTYTWLPSGTAPATASVASSMIARMYTVTASDANNCSTTQTVLITEPNALTLTMANVQACQGQQVVLTPTVTGGTAPYTYTWSPGSSNGSTLPLTASTTTVYSVQITDANSCTVPAVSATLQVTPSLSVSITGPTITCSNAPFTLTATGSGGNGNYNYTWQPGGQTGVQITTSITNTTQYTVTVSDGCTTQPSQAVALVNVLPAPTINIQSTNKRGCPSLCLQVFDSTLINSGLITAWQWSFSNGTVSTATVPNVCFANPGLYSATLTVQTANGCQIAPGIFTGIEVYDVPDADFSSNTFDATMSDPTFYLSDATTNGAAVLWTVGTATYTGAHVTLTYDAEGTYPVTLLAANTHGCMAYVTKSLVLRSDFTFYAPNAFTPNGDIYNDRFLPVGLGWKNETFAMSIFDRWGNLVFKTTDMNKGWDGRRTDLTMENNVYVWKVDVTDIFNKPHSFIGSVTVLR